MTLTIFDLVFDNPFEQNEKQVYLMLLFDYYNYQKTSKFEIVDMNRQEHNVWKVFVYL